MVIDSNMSTIRVLEPLAEEIAAFKQLHGKFRTVSMLSRCGLYNRLRTVNIPSFAFTSLHLPLFNASWLDICFMKVRRMALLTRLVADVAKVSIAYPFTTVQLCHAPLYPTLTNVFFYLVSYEQPRHWLHNR